MPEMRRKLQILGNADIALQMCARRHTPQSAGPGVAVRFPRGVDSLGRMTILEGAMDRLCLRSPRAREASSQWGAAEHLWSLVLCLTVFARNGHRI
jgi:hypothetical protein